MFSSQEGGIEKDTQKKQLPRKLDNVYGFILGRKEDFSGEGIEFTKRAIFLCQCVPYQLGHFPVLSD